MYPSRNVFVADIDDQAIVMDLEQDRYFGLSAALATSLRAALSDAWNGCAPPQTSGAVSTLIAKGVLDPQAPPRQRPQAPPPAHDLWPSETYNASALRPLEQLGALRALAAAAASLRRRTFARTVEWTVAKKAQARRTPNRSVGDLLNAFRDARPWFPTKPICRLDALALFLFLNERGHVADLVFGVRLQPFQAHCWVQLGDRAVNEAADRVRQFTPILTI